jgi:hypothetical protein
MKKIQYKFYALTFPSEFTIEQTLDFFDSVSTALSRGNVLKAPEYLVLELWSDKFGLKHRLGIPWQHTELLSQLRTHITGVHIEEDQREVIPDWSEVVEVGVSDNTRPFRIERVEAQVRRILGASIADLKPEDTLLIQWVIAPGDNVKPPSQVGEVMSSHWAAAALWKGVKADRDEIAERRANAAQNQFRAVLRVAASSTTQAHAKKLVDNIKGAYKVPETASVHFTNRWYIPKAKRVERINRASGPGIPYDFINALEVATFSTWPIGSPVIPGLKRGRTRYLPPNEVIEKSGRRLGLASASGYENRPIAVTQEGSTRHTYVIGPSGLGKTTLLRNNLQQDIEQGHGVIVFDGKGDLIAGGLDSVPRERLGDVVYLNFADHEYPVGFNVLQEGDPRSIVDDLMSLFLHNAGGDVYLREVLYHGLHTMRAIPGLTVVDLLPFLLPMTPKEEAWRDFIIESLPKNGQLHSYWKAFYALKPTERLQKIRPVQNRLWQLTNRADLRNMLGQSQSTISLGDILTENKILFVSIPQNLGSETVSLLGAIMFDAIWQQVQALNMTRPTHLYIDEVQRFLNLPIDLNDMLSTARSKNFGITMAHQYIDQLPKELFSAVTNASTKVAFKLEGPDAAKMTNLFGKAVTPEDFINLDKYEVIARVATPGGSSEPVTIKTFPEFQGHGLTQEVVSRSRQNYARKAEQVDAEIEARRTAPDKPRKARPSFGDG